MVMEAVNTVQILYKQHTSYLSFLLHRHDFEIQFFTPQKNEKHPKITTITPQKSKTCSFSRSIWEISHLREIFTRGPPVVPVTNMRYAEHLTGYARVSQVFGNPHPSLRDGDLSLKSVGPGPSQLVSRVTAGSCP